MALKIHWSGLSADWITNKWHLRKKKTSKHQKNLLYELTQKHQNNQSDIVPVIFDRKNES